MVDRAQNTNLLTSDCPSFCLAVPPSRGGDVAVYVLDINQPSFLTLVYSLLVPVSVFMTLSTVFHSVNASDNSPISHSVLPYRSFQLYVSL